MSARSIRSTGLQYPRELCPDPIRPTSSRLTIRRDHPARRRRPTPRPSKLQFRPQRLHRHRSRASASRSRRSNAALRQAAQSRCSTACRFAEGLLRPRRIRHDRRHELLRATQSTRPRRLRSRRAIERARRNHRRQNESASPGVRNHRRKSRLRRRNAAARRHPAHGRLFERRRGERARRLGSCGDRHRHRRIDPRPRRALRPGRLPRVHRTCPRTRPLAWRRPFVASLRHARLALSRFERRPASRQCAVWIAVSS